jgi:hypothetical protein
VFGLRIEACVILVLELFVLIFTLAASSIVRTLPMYALQVGVTASYSMARFLQVLFRQFTSSSFF